MKHIFTFFLVLSALVTFAQRPTATIEQVNAFTKTKTYVLKRDDLLNEYNSFMEKAMKENWKITEFEFITQEEFATKRLDPNSSFILLSEMNFPNDKTVASYDYISVIMGGDYKDISLMPEICSFPLAFTDSQDKDDVMNKIPAIIGFLNNHISLILENPKLLKDKKYKYYTKQKKNITKSTMYLVKEEQIKGLDTDKSIKPLYSGRVVFTDATFITNAMMKKDKTSVFLHKVSAPESTAGTRCYIIIMGGDGTLYYFNYHYLVNSSNNGITAKTWKTLSKFVK